MTIDGGPWFGAFILLDAIIGFLDENSERGESCGSGTSVTGGKLH